MYEKLYISEYIVNVEACPGAGQGESNLKRDKARIEKESDLMKSFRPKKEKLF